MKKIILFLFLVFALTGKSQSLYFPPITGTVWDSVSPSSLGWCQAKVDALVNYVGSTNAKAFIILKDGKIAVEKYYGTFTQDSIWYWASAGKTMTSFLMGLAQEQGYLNIHDSLPKYLGHGFSTCGTTAENSIRIIHQLTMTTGFDDMANGATSENHCTDDTCLVCIAPPNTRWAYHNAPYNITHWVLDSATHMTVNAFKNLNLNSKSGIGGLFLQSGYDYVYYSKARAFARFGLLIQNHGKWNTTTIMNDTAYFHQMINTSQPINLSYGYLWWLNGKSSFHFPDTQFQFPGAIEPDAPADMIAALGKNDQFLNIVPSLGIVMIRMGNPMFATQEIGNYSNDSIWVRFNDVFCSTASVNEMEYLQSKISIAPNPFTNQTTITFSEEQKNTTIKIMDLLGKEITTIILNGAWNLTIDKDNMNAGIYFVQITDDKKNVVTKKMVVQ